MKFKQNHGVLMILDPIKLFMSSLFEFVHFLSVKVESQFGMRINSKALNSIFFSVQLFPEAE
jgi:hypothetical protein